MSIKTAVIGTGNQAEAWSRQILNHSKYNLNYIISENYERGNRLANEMNCESLNNYEEILDNKKIDLVILASRPDKNKFAIKLAESKINLIIEKPLGFNIDDCLKIKDSCNKNEVLCGSGLKRYFDTYFEVIKKYQKT